MSETVLCLRCSVANPLGASFCSACGAELPGGHEVPTGTHSVVGVDVPGAGETGQLVVTRGSTAGARYFLGSTTTIGRHPDSTVFLDDVTVSRRHAEVVKQDDGHYVLTDAGSLNGTYVNGDRVTTAVLREGHQVQVGKFHMVFVIGQPGGAA